MFSPPFLYAVAGLVAFRVLRYFRALRAHGYVEGYRPLLDPHSLPGNAIPPTWWHMGFMWPWYQRKHSHFNHTHDLTTLIPLVWGNPAYFAASVGIVRQVWGNEAKTGLVKGVDFTTEGVWGSSIASANGENWKRHRRVVGPSFTQQMFSRVVDESGTLYGKMKSEFIGKDLVLNNLHALLLRFTFVMICRCGFGMPVDWKQSSGHDEVAIFDRALSVASTTLIHRLILPNWLWRLPIQSLRDINDSWDTVLTLVKSIAASRQAEYSTQKELGNDSVDDIFTKLVSSTDEGAKYSLNPAEVTGNMMSLLFAGHETTSSALLSVLVLLGLHPDEQQMAYEEIMKEIPVAENMNIHDVSALKYVLCCMHEAHRLIPATINLPRDVPDEIVLHSSMPVERDIVVQKGARIIVDIMAVCHNPTDFPDPEAFKPSRWEDVSDHDIIMFGAGPRACVGRRFAQVEAVCLLAHFLRDWRVETVLKEGETRAVALERVMAGASMYGTAFSLGEVPVRIVART
ncbi:cytochrome P450 [Favolaschia claudopus]|uniref:Cytochrome P450 n=1 Tax=Favolaschia claudopus TaxID=2862362 RepID=A0AAW0A0G3_9AGAR